MAATVTSIAKEAKVSIALVSRYLNNDPTLRVTDEKARQIQLAVERLGGLEAGRAARIRKRQLCRNFVMPLDRGFSMRWFDENFASSELFESMQNTLKLHNFRISLNFIDLDGLVEFTEDMIKTGYGDGLFLECRVVNEEFARYLRIKQIPHVCTDRKAEAFGINTVLDYAKSGLVQSVKHLLSLGHRHIGYVGTNYRFPEFLIAMMEDGVAFNQEDYIDIGELGIGENQSQCRDYAKKAVSAKFQKGSGPTAYVCQNDVIAFGVMDVLKEKGVKVGKDISIIGYDNIEKRSPDFTDEPILSTIDVPFDVIGARCAEVLIEQAVNNRKTIVHEHIPLRLIARSTTGLCPK